MQIRVVTYNIHKAIGGLDRRYRPQRIVEVLTVQKPDILLLQEVAEDVPRWHGHRQVEIIGEGLELRHGVFQANVKLREGYYGNAILSRFAISRIEDIELTVPLKKRRRALALRCRASSGSRGTSLWILNVHLGLSGVERALQIRRLLTHPLFGPRHRKSRLVMAGDFNDVWGNQRRRYLEPAGLNAASARMKTFPAFRPLRELDRIYFRGELRLVRCYASRSRLAREASDHLPVVADFEIPELGFAGR